MLVDAPDLAAENHAFNGRLAELLRTMPPVETVPPDASRRARREGRGIFPKPVLLPQARDLDIPSRGGELRLRVIPPRGEAAGVYLHVHGGGHVLGSGDGQDVPLAALAEATGLCAVSVDYRLAPEHPFPAAPDDCEGTEDPLLDDSLFMHVRWRAAGSVAELRVFPDAAHGFTLFPLAAARRANDEQHAFLRRMLG